MMDDGDLCAEASGSSPQEDPMVEDVDTQDVESPPPRLMITKMVCTHRTSSLLCIDFCFPFAEIEKIASVVIFVSSLRN